MSTSTRNVMPSAKALLVVGALALGGAPGLSGQTGQGTAGRLDVTFMYLPPGSVHPTYHTAMWLEDERGKLVKTLFVSQELSSTEYQVGEACPDWVKQANWEKVPKADVDAVTGPTPDVGGGSRSFDLGAVKIPPGPYIFNFQVHISEKDNLLFRGKVSVGGASAVVPIESLQSSKLPAGMGALVRDVEVRYVSGGTHVRQ